MARLEPLQDIAGSDAEEGLRLAEMRLGFIPNSLRIMARNPEIMAAYSALSHAIWSPSRISGELKGLISHISSRSATCLYCTAHTAGMALNRDTAEEKIQHIWEYETSPLFSEAERAALKVAQLASLVPNGVTDQDFDELKRHYDEEEIVEIVAVIAQFGFLNRWNDTMATALEEIPRKVGEEHLAAWGWTPGKHS